MTSSTMPWSIFDLGKIQTGFSYTWTFLGSLRIRITSQCLMASLYLNQSLDSKDGSWTVHTGLILLSNTFLLLTEVGSTTDNNTDWLNSYFLRFWLHFLRISTLWLSVIKLLLMLSQRLYRRLLCQGHRFCSKVTQ